MPTSAVQPASLPASERRARDRAILARYTDQAPRLPAEVRAAIEARWNGRPVQLYACADLDASLRLAEVWLALGEDRVAIARGTGDDITIDDFPRSDIEAVRETPGMSCHTLALCGPPDTPPLALLRYSHRQRRAMDTIRQLLDDETLEHPGDADARTGDADDIYARDVAGPIREAQALVAPTDAAIIVRLLAQLRPYRWHVAAGLAAAVVITALALVPAYLAGYLLDEVVRPVQSGTLSVADARAMGMVAVGAIAAAYLLRSVCTWIRLRFMAVIGEYVARDLRTQLYEHLQRLSMSFFSRKRTGSLITRVSSDTDRLWDFLAFGVVDVSLSVIMLLGLGTVLLTLDWRLGLVMTVPVPLLCVFIALHSRRMERYFLRAWRKWSMLTDVLSDTIPGMRVVKAFNQEDHEIHRFDERNRSAAEQFNQVHRVWTRFWPALMLIVHVMTVTAWALALPRLLGDGEPALSAGAFVSFLLYAGMFAGPIEVIGQMTRIMNRATSSAHRIFEVLDTEPELLDRAGALRLEPVRGDIELDGVTFSYDGVRPVLRDVSLSVRAGEMIGLVGPSGGGKTTLVSLIARFYDPTTGAVRIDGHDLRELDTGHYRRQVGMVLQDPYLFHGTVADNIRYGMHDASPDQVIAAARSANAHDFICRLPHGYDTVVGERGHTLSGGERQRVSIARAILHDPRILILDEATSSVDTETERKIDEAMDRLIAGRTVLAIAHRLSTLRRASRLLVIEGGRITESGTHAQLLADPDSTYRRLCEMQREIQRAV